MGCDIHMYVEYKRKDSDRWSYFGKRINPGRNYRIFTNLASVRGESDNKPKGMPEDAGYASRNDNIMYISDVESENSVTREKANRWVNDGYSKIVDEKWVTNPDWHSHSWATIEEMKSALGDSEEPEYRALIAAMESFRLSGYDVRVVYWFDN